MPLNGLPLPPNMNGINPLGPGPLPNMNMYQQPMQQQPGLPPQGLVQGSLGYPPQYNPYPPLPSNIPNYNYNKLSVEQNQNPPSVWGLRGMGGTGGRAFGSPGVRRRV
jgi:hypothetical protein